MYHCIIACVSSASQVLEFRNICSWAIMGGMGAQAKFSKFMDKLDPLGVWLHGNAPPPPSAAATVYWPSVLTCFKAPIRCMHTTVEDVSCKPLTPAIWLGRCSTRCWPQAPCMLVVSCRLELEGSKPGDIGPHDAKQGGQGQQGNASRSEVRAC
jgi:hypothetical protein